MSHLHLLVTHCTLASESGRQALEQLAAGGLPHLGRLLARLEPVEPDHGHEADPGDEWTLTPPHERVLARCLGWPLGNMPGARADGCLPWAADELRRDGIDTGAAAWGRLTPVHWLMGRDHLTTLPPSELALTADESRALFEAAAPLFESDGWQWRWQAPDRWYAAHASLADLPTASLDRVAGRNPDAWMPDHPQARWIKRLLNEVQMLWYQHPVNEAREARRQLTINTLWLSGCGAALPTPGQAPTVCDALREPSWREDLPAWLQAWQHVDQTAVRDALERAEQGQPVTLTLAGERHARSFTTASSRGPAWWQGLRRLGRLGRRPVDPLPILHGL